MENRKLNPYLIVTLVFAVIFGLSLIINRLSDNGNSTSCNPDIKSNEFITWEELAQMPGPVQGCGLTVFKGTKVEPFEVEFDGVVPHPIFKNEKMILVRMGRPLIGSQVLAGMSGSPVYFKKDGKWKLAGATAFGFNIPTSGRSLGGITPIQAMLGQRQVDFGRRPKSSRETEERYLSLKSGNLQDPAVREKLNELRNRLIHEMSKPVLIKNRDGSEVEVLQPTFSLSAKPAAAPEDSNVIRRPRPGDAVTMMLADGDLSLGGTCTVTYVTETKFWACGHPILMDGPLVAPARMASIATSYKGPFNAFKMVGDQHESAGYISYDGMFAIEGVLKKLPKNAMLPIRINLNLNGQRMSINYRVFRHKLYSEAMMAQIGSQALEPLWNPNRKATVAARSKIRYDGKSLHLYESSSAGPPIAFGPFLISANPWSAVSKTAQVTGNLISSEWNFKVENVEMNIDLKEGEGALQLDSLKVLNSKDQIIDTVSPGDEIQLLVAVRTAQGTRNRITSLPIRIPNITDIKKSGSEDEDSEPSVTIFVQSGNLYNEQDERKTRTGIPENKSDFINKLMMNERDPNRIFVQVVLPPTKITSVLPKAVKETYRNSWHEVPTLKFLRSVNSVERKIVRMEIDSPSRNYILNVNGAVSIRLNIPKKPENKSAPKP